jgi:hypothetical protein
MAQFPLKMRALPEGRSPSRLETQCYSIFNTTINPATTSKLPPATAAQYFHKLYRSHLSIKNVTTFLWTLWSVLLDVEKQVEKGGEEWKLLEETVWELRRVEEKLNWKGCELEWNRLPGFNWVRYCPDDEDDRR